MGSFTGYFEAPFFYLHIWVPFLDPEDVANLSCGTEEQTSLHMLCECEALASLRQAYLVPSFWTPANLSMGAIWNCGKGTPLL